ncbi:hypothetical protein DQP57_00440 [Mycobacterium colombiense]|uniref:PE-PPE domain-containing protein n=2 Tax=Mycobacterium colombiense TaxID=339268 RepID=A0A329MIU7_9MYCO|nr:hypothetical protein DQP57_00440 [Mycobacterium colombiense]
MLGAMVGGVNPWQIVADKLDGLIPSQPPWRWQPIGYPAAVFPMTPSVQNARKQIIAALGGPAFPDYQAPVYDSGPFSLAGYSQGALATDIVWVNDILAEDGVLHHRLPDCYAVVNFGDPMRTPGISNGNTYQGIPVPGTQDGEVTGGIAGAQDLTEEQTNYPNPLGKPTVMSFNLPGDLYGSAPVGPHPQTDEAGPGKIGTAIYDFVESGSIVDFLKIPVSWFRLISAFEEGWNAASFFAAGTNAAHWQYANQGCVAAAASYLLDIANALGVAA